MKFLFITILFITSNCLSQKNIDSLMLIALDKKEVNFFKLKKHFKGVSFTDEKIKSFLEKSKEVNYPLGKIFAKNIQGYSYRKKEYMIKQP
ncbi:hypothetical protein PG913_00530 [Tenacibaculum pacificus]|uniref:hypothetical protein n=1 Tax=Tenacibaculum pacificus TaxID=3018314 RepID=UPI0022F3CB83|nr:hypothetical protein [Tenacibaculum pacificus]WBX73778.1 hypothetical protein PG913_00530 [Tenacibaculum pacificus]